MNGKLDLSLARGLQLPGEAVARTFGVLGQRGSGKSNVAVVMAERMFDAGLHWVAIDPKGDWWGVRTSRDGKEPGLPVVIFGGAHADVPLEPTGGPLLADLVVDEHITCVLDVSEFTEGEKIRFLAGHGKAEGFAGRLYRRKNGEQDPTHLFLEECHDYIPQKPFRDQAKLVHVFGKLVTMGRTKGLGATLISQRSARVHKDVLTQVDSLIVLRTTGPQDRKVVKDWLEYHGQAKEVLESLPTLKDGQGWLWSPEWLGMMKKVQFYQRKTFDSGATPVQGRARRRPATLADVDLTAIKTQMAETIERAKADDPKELQGRIRQLERELAKLQREKPAAIIETVEVPVLTDDEVKRFEIALLDLRGFSEQSRMRADSLVKALDGIGANITNAMANIPTSPVPVTAVLPRPVPTAANMQPRHKTKRVPQGGEPNLKKCDRSILALLANYPEGCLIGKLALLSGYRNTGSFRTSLSTLRTVGFIEGNNQDVITITDAGLASAEFEELPSGRALIEYWTDHPRFKRCDRAILDYLVRIYPRGATIDVLAEGTGYENTGSFRTSLSTLRTAGVITGKNTEQMTVTEDLAAHIR